MTNHQPQTQPEKQKQNHPATFFNSSSVIPTTSKTFEDSATLTT